jgi:DNA-binding NarL/FixJ family response regulator
MKQIIIVDDHPLVASGIARLFEGHESLEVIGIYQDPYESLEKIKILQPDIVLVDLEMPVLNGLELIERIRKEGLNVKTIILTMHLNQSVIKKVMEMNVDGYLPKQADEYEFEACLQAVSQGNRYYSQKAMEILAATAQKIEKTGLQKTQKLTKREKEVLKQIVLGQSTKAIAEKLFIAVRTVETHRKAIMEKLEVNNVAGMVRIAMKEGVVD